GSHANLVRPPALQFPGDLIEIGEERLDEGIEFFSGGSQVKRTALKERHAEKFLQLSHLAAYGGLLNSIGNVAHGLSNPPMPCDVVEQLQVMYVHISRVSRLSDKAAAGCN